MTPTEKRYTKNVGNLFLAKCRTYSYDSKKYVMEHRLCFIEAINKGGWRGKGPWEYTINTLSPLEEMIGARTILYAA